MKFSIIIPTYKYPLEGLRKTFESLFTYTDLEDKEIIVVSNGQSEEVNQYLKDLRSKKLIKLLIYPEPLGYARAINNGIKNSMGEYIILLNDDIELLPQEKDLWINMLLQPILENPRIGFTGPLKASHSIPNTDIVIDFIIFFCVLIPKKIFIEIGLLDEGFGMAGAEDTEFCYRASKLGYTIQEVPPNQIKFNPEIDKYTGGFPIFHEGSYTVTRLEGHDGLYERNTQRLNDIVLMSGERINIGKSDRIGFFEAPRWIFFKEVLEQFEKENGRKAKVLEFGCGTTYQLRYFGDLVDFYLGIDYDPYVVDFAKIDFKGNRRYFIKGEILSILRERKDLLDYFDFVVASEILEHIDNWKEAFYKIATKSRGYFITLPYNEPPEIGFKYHKHFNITEKDFEFLKDYEIFYQTWGGTVTQNKEEKNIKTFYFLKRPPKPKLRILAYVVTRDRYFITLPLTIQSLINQNRMPDKILIIDDGNQKDWENSPLFKYLEGMIYEKGGSLEIKKVPQKGQVYCHQKVNTEWGKDFDWVFRIDDDEVAEKDVIENFEKYILSLGKGGERIGAVGVGCFLPYSWYLKDYHPITDFGIKVNEIYLPNIQWSNYEGPIEVEHLHSCFFYKAGIVNYPLNLSPVGHREETIFTYRLFIEKKKLIAFPNWKVYHLQQPMGGIRTHKDPSLYEKDQRVFTEFLKMNKIFIKEPFWVVDIGGIGDSLVLKRILPEIKEKHKDKQIVLATDKKELYNDIDYVRIVTLALARRVLPNFDEYNIYRFMETNKWNKSIEEAYRRMYVG